jgi:hypothetical protein
LKVLTNVSTVREFPEHETVMRLFTGRTSSGRFSENAFCPEHCQKNKIVRDMEVLLKM